MQITLHTVKQLLTVSAPFLTHSVMDLQQSGAHLSPILHIYTKKNIDIVHFLSGSLSTQYRNKKMYFFLRNNLKTCFPGIINATWNYHESGHGKGTPDCIGGTCKRNADRVVAQETATKFVPTL